MTPRRQPTRGAAGFSLIEAVMATLIVGVLFVAAILTVGATGSAQLSTADRARGEQLALDLMNEILQQAYWEPDERPTFGIEGAETTTSRARYDDVDDYNGWTESPPQNKNGTILPGLTGWTRRVAVEWVDPADLTVPSATATDLKRITVTVLRGDTPKGTLVSVRCAAWANTLPAAQGAGGNHAPRAAAYAAPVWAKRNTSVAFDAGNSSDFDGDTLTYAWRFGDGKTATTRTATNTYSAAGTYTATLTVSDGRGGTDSDGSTIIVSP